MCVARSLAAVNEMKRRFEREQSEGARMSLSGGAKFFQRRKEAKEMRSSQNEVHDNARARVRVGKGDDARELN